ncbi:probable F-box protein At4g22030 [Rosa rugosa]|uniref:probable F-box protein At4g22030 n=1 Tax=Rosa rugosa TaxID=74645 RepID=UPI002B40BA7F|nr:probable F-box protein At4g22030 [Rosa rugosa]
MATFQVSTIFPLRDSSNQKRIPKGVVIVATNNAPNGKVSPLTSLPKLPTRSLVEGLDMKTGAYKIPSSTVQKEIDSNPTIHSTNSALHSSAKLCDPVVMSEIYAIMEVVADRVEMHKNIGAQRDNWNHLLLSSINVITLTAATIAGIAASSTASAGVPFTALKVSSALLYVAATGMLVVMNMIQPSQLAEEQRIAARLFKQLHSQIQTTVSLQNPNTMDVKEAIEKVLALDRAYPLPLLGEMLDKFPKTVEPAIWWPQQKQLSRRGVPDQGIEGRLANRSNSWSAKLEEEMTEIVGVLKSKDVPEYLRLTEIALKINRILAISGPLLTGLAALGSAFLGCSTFGVWSGMVGVIGGALASVVNTIEHGGQVGMVVEMYRSNAGFFRLMQETIEANLREKEVGRRENGQVLEMKVALQLGRSLSELKHLSVFSYGSKLF